MEIDSKPLDGIQEQVFGLLETYVDAGKDTSTDNESIIKRCQDLLVEYGNYVQYLRLKYGLVDVEHGIYLSRLDYLRERVRQVQLHVKQQEQEVLHRARIHKFETEKEEAVKRRKLASETSKSTREALFGLRKDKNGEGSKETLEHQILAHNKKITTSLQSTRQLMSTSIVQTELNLESLDQQTKDLSNLNDQLFTVSDILNKSGKIVKFIEKQDRKDKRRIYYSIFFFASCCAWVIWKRILKTPVKIFLWSTFKMFRLVNWAVSSKNINNKEVAVDVDSLSVVATVTSVIASSITLASLVSSSISELLLQVVSSIEMVESSEDFSFQSRVSDVSAAIDVDAVVALSEDPIIHSFTERQSEEIRVEENLVQESEKFADEVWEPAAEDHAGESVVLEPIGESFNVVKEPGHELDHEEQNAGERSIADEVEVQSSEEQANDKLVAENSSEQKEETDEALPTDSEANYKHSPIEQDLEEHSVPEVGVHEQDIEEQPIEVVRIEHKENAKEANDEEISTQKSRDIEEQGFISEPAFEGNIIHEPPQVEIPVQEKAMEEQQPIEELVKEDQQVIEEIQQIIVEEPQIIEEVPNVIEEVPEIIEEVPSPVDNAEQPYESEVFDVENDEPSTYYTWSLSEVGPVHDEL
ncbi:Protein transport protein sec20 [Scheffersomyces spartinae]|uniref:Protein transport protein sec20 n=1 Tax=Scheffersomyces spartinae TaxID=45513 RepID=A0A9P7VAQ9_9ASCO|nr:Protein transport protein sec20 [Scheffersomyces spartinae]KAG7194494.1 Protein transport protein sec20 [Scheffersomyces spartinae]